MNLVSKNWFTHIFLGIVLAFAASSLSAESNLTPERYVEIDLIAQAVTLEGVRQRLVRLQENPYDEVGQRQVGETVAAEVTRIFDEYGISQRKFLEYGAEHAGEIESWLSANPTIAREYADLEATRTEYSNQIQAIKE